MEMATGEPKQGSPSFFKVVRYPSAPHLSLPIAFVKRYLDKIPKNPTLKTVTGEHSWQLKFEKIGEDYCFADGWEKLAKDAELHIRDIIVFWLIDSFTFQVSFFDEHGCGKDLLLDNNSDGDEDVDEQDEHDDDSVTRDEDLYFQKVISGKTTHRYAMLLPKRIVDAGGLENKASIILRDNEGKEWKLGLRSEKHRTKLKLYLSAGWRRFRRYHELSDGDMCLFKYIKEEGVLILAQLIKRERPTQPETEVEGVKWRIGRPPVEKLGFGGGGVMVKDEYDSGPEAEVLKRKRGRPLSEKYSGEVKIEDESWPEVGVVKRKREELPPFEKLGGGGGGVKVKIEDDYRGGPPFVKACGGGVEVKTEPETERVFKYNRVIYF